MDDSRDNRQFGSIDEGADDIGGIDRRQFLASAAVLTAPVTGMSAASGQSQGQAVGNDWPMFQRDPEHSGYQPATETPTGASLRWQETSLDVGRSQGFSAVVDGTAYVTHDGRLHAYAAEDGSGRWSFDPGGDSLSRTPAVANGTVLIGGTRLYALNAEDGTRQWTVGGQDTVGTPTVADGTVYAVVGDRLTAVDLQEGTEQWSQQLTARSVGYLPAVTAGTVVVENGTGLAAFDTADGTPAWRRSLGRIESSLSVADGNLFTVTQQDMTKKISCLRIGDGSIRWQRAFTILDIWEVSPLATTGESVYLAANGIETPDDWPSGLHALDAATGERRWVNEAVAMASNEVPPSIAVVSDVVLVGNAIGRLWAVDTESGDVQWDIERQSRMNPVPAGESLYVQAVPNDVQTEGQFYALDFEFPDDGGLSTVTLDGQGTSSRTNYLLTVSSDLEAAGGIGSGDSIQGSTAIGFVNAGTDRYRYTGEIDRYTLVGGDAVLTADDLRVSPENGIATSGAEGDVGLLTIDGSGTDSRTNYRVEVSGDLRAGSGTGTGDTVDGSTAEGFVRAGTDQYEYTGEIARAVLTGGDAVLYDGETRVESADE
jgi:hypothetical protein